MDQLVTSPSVAAGDGSCRSQVTSGMGQLVTSSKCSSWRWVRLVTSSKCSSLRWVRLVAAGDGSRWSQVPSVAAGDGSGWSQVQLLMGQAGHKFQV